MENKTDPALAITASITAAIHDPNPKFSLEDIYKAVTVTNTASLLDPLNVLPLLVPCPIEASVLLIQAVCENCSGKEVVITISEILERLVNSVNIEEYDSETDGRTLPPTPQLERIILAYACSIPRLTPRLKSAPDILAPLVRDLQKAIIVISLVSSPTQSRTLIQSVSAFVQTASTWIKSKAEDATQLSLCIDALFGLLEATLSSNANSLQTSVAQRVFETLYPRLVIRSAVNPDWEQRERVVKKAIVAADALGFPTERLVQRPIIGSLILLAHSNCERFNPMEIIQTFSSPIYTSLQTNVAFEETVALLLKCFITLSRAGEELPGNLSIPFSIILPPLVAAHPDPPMRHLLFRLLSIFLSLLMAKYRLQVLEDLLTNTAVHTPQMRIAAIGLVKDSVLETLNSSTRLEPSYDVFGTSLCLDRLDHVLFRLDPLDLFQSTGFNVDEFAQSPEPKRLVESLALYYVVMQRDTENRTGIRDPDRIARVEKDFLHPLRQFLQSGIMDSFRDHEIMMTFAGLQTSLERVDEALNALAK